MALNNTLVFVCNINKNEISVWDKYVKVEKFSIPLENSYYYVNHVIDSDRQKLWVAVRSSYNNGSMYIQRYSITDSGYTFDFQAGSIGGIGSSSHYFRRYKGIISLNTNTGDFYYMNQQSSYASIYQSHTISVYKVNDLGELSSITIPRGYDYLAYNYNVNSSYISNGSYQIFYQTAPEMEYNPETNSLFVFRHFDRLGSGYSNNYTQRNELKSVYEIDVDFTTITPVDGKYDCSSSIYDYRTSKQVANKETKHKLFNPITKKILDIQDNYLGRSYQYSFFSYLNKDDISDQTRKTTPVGNYSDYSMFLKVNKNDGNIHHFGQHSYTVLNPILKTKATTTRRISYPMEMNEVSNEIYTYDSSKNSIQIWNEDQEIITQSPTTPGDELRFSPNRIGLMIGGYEYVSNGILPSIIVTPNEFNPLSDTTPTIIFKVGKNPTDWTQQFRVIADTDAISIGSKGFTDAYERVLDSWITGSNYVDANWEYSTDYDQTDYANPDNGTWSALGTGESLQSGGTMPAQGINTDAGTVYVKLTLPESHALTGLDTNQEWFFKIYNYSKFV